MTKPANPKRTGGPRTSAGRVVASGNSLKLGSYAKSVLIPGESQDDFDLIVQTLDNDFQVQDSIERLIVRQIADVIWKLQRLERIEGMLQAHEMALPIKASEIFALGFPESNGVRYLLELPEPLSDHDEQYLLQKSASASISDSVSAQKDLLMNLQEDRPGLFKHLESHCLKYSNGGQESKIFLVKIIGLGRDGDDQTEGIDSDAANALYKSMIELRDAVKLLQERGAEVAELQVKVKMQRLQNLAEHTSMSRPQAELQRLLHKLLAEIRKHKDWRKNNRMIDMNAAG